MPVLWKPFAVLLVASITGFGFTPELAAQRGQVQAVAGDPFGVARITVSLDPAAAAALQDGAGYSLRAAEGRVFYPAFTRGRVGELLGELLGGSVPSNSADLTVSFLFTGQQPLELTIEGAAPRTVIVRPTAVPPRIRNRLLMQWWRDYNATARQLERQGDMPPLVHTYLTTMLAQRLGLRPPLLTRINEQESSSDLQQAVELLAGVEDLRTEVMRETMRGGSTQEAADQAVPAEILWTPPQVSSPAESVGIEPIARHVPVECLYIRFGSFANYRWMSRLLQDYGGDIGQMVTLRGRNDGLNDKLQYQLVLQESALADLFGGQVIADVAIIGRDLYLREGAALGVLFQAKSNLGLQADLQRQRQAALAAERQNGAVLETVQIAGRDVSLLSTPDNRLRSFYAVDGDFHLVTTSRSIVARFFEVGGGPGSLAESAEFQHARASMPLEREDTIFAYFSSAFWSALMSPQYQIELRRRLKAVTDIELIELARLAAAAEGQPGETIEQLVAGGFLPAGFGRNADGSGPILETDRVIDSLRGARGTFQPIADVALRGLTTREAQQYLDQASFFQTRWKQMDPLMVGIKRYALNREGLERIVVDANVSPLAEEKYGWVLSMLGPPSTHQIAPVPGDIVTVQALLRGGLFRPEIPVHHLFLGIQDTPAGIDLRPTGLFELLRLLRQTPGYLGSWPQLGLLNLLPLGPAGQPDPAGFSQLPLGAWRWQGGDFSLLSFQPAVLEHAALHVKPQVAETPAQVSVRVGNLAASQLAGVVTAASYRRAWQASRGNVRLLHTLSEQLKVPRELALQVAERLLDTRLVCAVGGEYQLADRAGLQIWESTNWPDATGALPEGYQAPLLAWFRGLEADLTKAGDSMMLHARIDMQRQAGEAPLELPLFKLFEGRPQAPPEPEELPAPKKQRSGSNR